MSAKQIGMALGSIASYAAAKDVPFVRIIFCDAKATDAGYLAPEDIAGRVKVTGRGGTILQPGVDCLEQANDFPKDGPILSITDGEIEDNMIHLMRGQIFTIDGLKFFTFGGAYSIDKMSRAEGISWFPEEIPSREEYEEGWANLEKEDFQVDYILTHTAPRDVAAAMGYGELSDDEVELRQYLQRVTDETEFQKWYFGHFHEDAEVEEMFVCLYDEIVELS